MFSVVDVDSETLVFDGVEAIMVEEAEVEVSLGLFSGFSLGSGLTIGSSEVPGLTNVDDAGRSVGEEDLC